MKSIFEDRVMLPYRFGFSALVGAAFFGLGWLNFKGPAALNLPLMGSIDPWWLAAGIVGGLAAVLFFVLFDP